MSKQNREQGQGRGPAMEQRPLLGPGGMRFATLLGVAVVIFITVINWNETRRLQTALNERLNQLDNRLTLMTAKLDSQGRAAAPARQGPDPNKVYTVKTEGSPFRGPKNAPVTIAEFSDFQ